MKRSLKEEIEESAFEVALGIAANEREAKGQR
jgi:hypothetical protein